MSVPSHNLYDFIHQLTERRFWLLYFYPWGSRNVEDLIDYQINDETDMINHSHGIPIDKRLTKKIFPAEYCNNVELIKITQPVLLCHDQEPLNYELYKDDSPSMIEYLNKKYKIRWGIEVCPLMNQNLRYVHLSYQKRWILLHSEKNSHEVQKYQNTGQYQGAFWWSHAMLSLDWYRYAQFDLSLHHSTHKKLFLIYAREFGGTRKYRKRFLEKIKNIEHCCQIGSNNQTNVTSDSSSVYCAEDFINTDISVVLETLFEDQRIHLTEKTLRPIACGHPFILAAGAGSLDFIRSYGFETFSPFIDETYDTISDHDERLNAVVDEMNRIENLDKRQKDKLISECKTIALRNQSHFFSEKFYKHIVNELQTNVRDASNHCKDFLDFQSYLSSQDWKEKTQLPAQSDVYNDRSISNHLIRYMRNNHDSFEQYQSHQHRLDDKSSTDGHDV